MGERDLGSKTSRMRDRGEHAGSHAAPLGDRGDVDGTLAEVLPEEELADREDEDLAEALRTDRHDVPEDDYVQDVDVPEDEALRGVVDPEPEIAAERIDADARDAHPRPKARRPEPPRPR